MSAHWKPPVRPEYVRALVAAGEAPAARPFKALERARRSEWLRKSLLLLALSWEALARWTGNELLLPGALATARALAAGLGSGALAAYAGVSLAVLVQGYVAGIAVAFMLTSLAVSTRIGRDLLETLTAMFNPLPAIALLPLALLWFGLGRSSLVFFLMHSVMWPLALSTYAGFRGVPETLRMAGRNYGLGPVHMVLQILVPAALPAILSGRKIGWAFGWRTLIASRAGVRHHLRQGGLGWYIFQSRNELYTDNVFAGLAVAIVIGLLVEHLVFASLERCRIRSRGMQR
jgi:NitT/TauT family transport system permease protein